MLILEIFIIDIVHSSSSDEWIWTYGTSVCEWCVLTGRGTSWHRTNSTRFSECRFKNTARISYGTGDEMLSHLYVSSPKLFFSQISMKV